MWDRQGRRRDVIAQRHQRFGGAVLLLLTTKSFKDILFPKAT